MQPPKMGIEDDYIFAFCTEGRGYLKQRNAFKTCLQSQNVYL